MGEGVTGWLLALAAAQSPAPQPDPPASAYEVTVWGEAAIRQSRSAVVRELVDIGYRKGREADGQVHFRPPQAWMGRLTLDYDGTLTFRRPVIALQSARAANPVEYDANPHFDRDPGGLRYDEGWALPHPEGTFWLLPGWGVLGPAHDTVRERVDPLLQEYRAVVEATRQRE